MRAVILTIAAAAGLVAAVVGVTRIPAVEDRLFARAVDSAIGRNAAALFDGDGLKVYFCGTGSPLPSNRRAQVCTAVFAGDAFYLIDAGTGSWENVQAAGIPGGRLGGVFLTHFHSDHIGDLSEANLGSWVLGRSAPLAVFGGDGVKRVVEGHNEAFALDAVYRTAHHGEAIAPSATAGLEAREFDAAEARVIFERDGLTVTAFPVPHPPILPAVGYRFDYKGRSVVVSGDTAYSDELVRVSKDVDVLIHEAQANHMVEELQRASAKAGAANSAQIFADIPSYHTTPVEAARAANEAGAQWLVLSHLTPSPDNAIAKRIFMRGVRQERGRNVKLAEDGLLIRLPEAGGVEFDRR